MTHRNFFQWALGDCFAAGLEEYKGRTPEDAATTDIAVRNAVQTVRDLMREDNRRGTHGEETGTPDDPRDLGAQLRKQQG